MPKRISVETHESVSVQGDGSWVKIVRPTVGQMKAVQRNVAQGKQLDEADQDIANFEVGVSLIRECVLEWNWVDNDGAPLPQVKTTPTVVDELTDLEMMYLVKLFNPDADEAKNDAPAS